MIIKNILEDVLSSSLVITGGKLNFLNKFLMDLYLNQFMRMQEKINKFLILHHREKNIHIY